MVAAEFPETELDAGWLRSQQVSLKLRIQTEKTSSVKLNQFVTLMPGKKSKRISYDSLQCPFISSWKSVLHSSEAGI